MVCTREIVHVIRCHHSHAIYKPVNWSIQWLFALSHDVPFSCSHRFAIIRYGFDMIITKFSSDSEFASFRILTITATVRLGEKINEVKSIKNRALAHTHIHIQSHPINCKVDDLYYVESSTHTYTLHKHTKITERNFLPLNKYSFFAIALALSRTFVCSFINYEVLFSSFFRFLCPSLCSPDAKTQKTKKKKIAQK